MYESMCAVTHPAPKRPSATSQAARGRPIADIMPLLLAFVPRWISQTLRFSPPALFGEPPAAGLGRGPGWPPLPPDLEPRCDRFPEALEGDLAVSPLAPLFLSHGADHGACLPHEAPLLGGRKNGRRLDVEDRFDAGLGLLRMLASRPARAREPELDLAERKLEGLPVAELDA